MKQHNVNIYTYIGHFPDTWCNTFNVITINGLIFLSRCSFKVFLLSSEIDNTLDNPMVIQKEDKQASRVFHNKNENRLSETRHQNLDSLRNLTQAIKYT